MSLMPPPPLVLHTLFLLMTLFGGLGLELWVCPTKQAHCCSQLSKQSEFSKSVGGRGEWTGFSIVKVSDLLLALSTWHDVIKWILLLIAVKMMYWN